MVLDNNDDAEGCNEDPNICKKPRIEEQVDRLSILPDCILHHIFSFLPTLDVVGTSVLANRWRYLWTLTPVLDFDDRQFVGRKYDFASFVNFVHASYRATTIDGYRLSVEQPSNAEHVQTWVNFALKMKTEELRIDSCSSLEMSCSDTLKDLRIRLHGEVLKMPTTAGCFSSLEALSLKDVTTENTELDVSSYIFPRLKSLKLKQCLSYSCIKVRCPFLEEMKINHCHRVDQLTIFAEKLNRLSVRYSSLGVTRVKIIAPRLQTLRWEDFALGIFSFGNFTCLRDVDISLRPHFDTNNTKVFVQNAISFLNRFACAETLQVEMAYFLGLSIQNSLSEVEPPLLHNLKHLSIATVEKIESVFPAISDFLKICPNLSTLRIIILDNDIRERIIRIYPEATLLEQGKELKYQHSPLDKLLEVSLSGFSGSEHEIEFVEYLLKNAVMLKILVIDFSKIEVSADPSSEIRTMQRLSELRQTYPDVVISSILL